MLCIVSELKSPPFTDPLSDISLTILQLEEIYNDIVNISHSHYDGLSKWRTAITGEPTDATEMKKAMAYLKARMEIWRNLRTFNATEREWLTKPFKKLNVQDVGEKLKKWLSTIDSLSQILSVDDPVLMTLSERINEYNNLLPLLKKLSSPSVKHTHWYTLLAAVEVQYNSSTLYTLQDLLLYKLLSPENRPLLNEVCQSAEREAALKNSVETLQKKWEGRKFVLDKESYEKYSFAFPLSSPSPDILTETRESLRVTKFALSSPSMESSVVSASGPSITRLVDAREVLQELEEDLTLVQVYCGSPHCVGGLKGQLEYWSSALRQLMELVELVESCQNKWWSCLYLFGDIPTEEHLAYGLTHVQSASEQWSNVLKHIREQDGSVLTLFPKQLMGLHAATGDEDQSIDTSDVSWLSESVPQAALLTVQSKWTPIITSAFDNALMIDSARSQFERIINHLIQLLHLTSSYPHSHPQTITTLKSLIVSAKHKLDLIKNITRGLSLSHHVLYQLLESPVLYHPSPSRLSSVPSSMTNSRNSMPPLAAVGRLHPLPEPLVASNKSLVSSRFSAGTQSHTKPSGLSSAKSLMPTVPSIGTGCRVQCGPEVSFSYGFEYYGSDTSIVLSPSLEKSVVSMMRSLVAVDGCSGLLVSEGHRGKSYGSNLESARDVAKILGRPYYTLTCLSTTSTSVLLSSLSSSLQSGSILILQSFTALPVPAQLVVSQWLKEVYEKMKNGLLGGPDPVLPPPTNKIQVTGGGGPYSVSSTASLGSHHDYKSSSTSHVGAGNRMDWYSSVQHGANLLGPKAEIELTGEERTTLVANGYFSCIAVTDEGSDNEREDEEEEEMKNYPSITEEVIASFRCVQSESLDLVPITECLLLSSGYSNAASIAIKLVDCLNELKVNGIIKISMSLLKLLCTTYCHQQLLSSSQYSVSQHKDKTTLENMEKKCVWRALMKGLHFSESDKETGLQIIDTKLGICVEEETQGEVERGHRKTLMRAIEKEFEERHLQMKPEITEKIMELDGALESRRCVIIYGPSSSGKSTLYQLLSQAHNHLLSNNGTVNEEGKKGGKGGKKKMIYVTHINPEAYTLTELFGGYLSSSETATGSKYTDESSWSTGILARLFQQAEDSNNRTIELKDRERGRGGGGKKGTSLSITHWIVFNGFNWNHIHWLESLLTHPHKLKLSNGDTLSLPGTDNKCIIILMAGC
ncbi:PREDICTED: uncharacterized protein LOC105314715 [Amphimedon queenslandica]|uniref:Uncharacterized protein n=1 Tax=Amphimedon queenslandica TaxID=400682 RepID=A0AAN0IQA8_AMPQE|nr:PREDICTED: uncharacterized protein LOC105314715 [Amphimedon queenslandica]|eukprot:XP_011407347.2 PREDICTED: uncharacterized protein LOC105314715 [Amphimedon queenslandica]